MTQEAKELRVKLRRYILRIQNKNLSDAFTLWYDDVQHEKKERELQKFMNQINALESQRLAIFAKKLQNAWLTKAWNHWFGLFVQLRKIKTALGRMRNRAVAGAFDRWMEMVQEQKEMRTLLKRAAMKIQNRLLSGAYAR